MKRILLLFLLALLPLAASAGKPAARTASKSKLAAVVSEFRGYDGVEVVKLGWLGTAAVKSVVRMAAKSDPDAKQALDVVRGVKRFTVLEYDGCTPAVRERITRRLDQALHGSELLMEAKDGSERVQMFGVVDDATGEVRDFVMHAPSSHALICIFGSIPMESVAKVLSDD